MNLKRILAELKAEKDGLEAAIAAIIRVYTTGPGKVVRPPKAVRKSRRRSGMSAAGRKRISDAQKARWAKLKKSK